MKLGKAFDAVLIDELVTRYENGTLPPAMRQLIERWQSEGWTFEAPDLDYEGLEFPRLPIQMQVLVKPYRRPSLLIRHDDFQDPDSERWKDLLHQHRRELTLAIPSAGRIEVEHHPDTDYVGTAVLVAPRIVATNRHVVKAFAASGSSGWTWKTGLGDREMEPEIDTLREHLNSERRVIEIESVLHVDPEDGLDLAFLQLAEDAGSPATLSSDAAALEDGIAIIGYPKRLVGLSADLEEEQRHVFGGIFNVKRLAPGWVLSVESDRFAHDASVQSGSSGSPVVAIESGEMLGLHVESPTDRNFAISSQAIRERLAAL